MRDTGSGTRYTVITHYRRVPQKGFREILSQHTVPGGEREPKFLLAFHTFWKSAIIEYHGEDGEYEVPDHRQTDQIYSLLGDF